MTAIAFDTLKSVQTLHQVGFEDRQAVWISDTFKEAFEGGARFTTLRDIDRLDAKIDQLEMNISRTRSVWLMFGANGREIQWKN